ncbi:MAG: nucleoside deaminase [Planctomycetes bacterium]|nr:nucleoside deaminase [Planctomycetota bacterium]
MNKFMAEAIAEARKGAAEGGIPIGSVLVHQGRVIGRGHNRRVQHGSAILHGEMDALEAAGRLSPAVYRESTLYTTLSPCAMCAGAVLLYRIPKVVIGENSTFLGEEELLKARGVAIEVLSSRECLDMMQSFISEHPDLWMEDIGETSLPTAGCEQP